MPLHEIVRTRKHCSQRWGHWRLNRENWTLGFWPTPHATIYEVDIEFMNTSAVMLDWIFQVRTHTWATRADMGDLLHALDELFYPQANLCSHRASKTMNAKEYLRKIEFEPEPGDGSPKCAYQGCLQPFAPKRRWQRYCGDDCKRKATYERHLEKERTKMCQQSLEND